MNSYQFTQRLYWLIVLLMLLGIYIVLKHPEWLLWFFTIRG